MRQRSSAVKRRLQSPLACSEGDLPLPKLGNGAILTSKPSGSRQMSAGGKVVEFWATWDRLSALEQLGAAPAG
jgi:hypothetical protein